MNGIEERIQSLAMVRGDGEAAQLTGERLPRTGRHEIALVQREKARRPAQPQLTDHRLDCSELGLVAGVRTVEHHDQEVGLGELLEGRAKGGHEVLRKILEKAYRVGDDELALLGKLEAATQRIERGEQLVLHQGRRIGERIQKSALAGIGIANKGDRGHLLAVAASPSQGADARKRIDLALEARDLLAHAPAIDLQLGLARPATADAAGEPRQAVPAPLEPRQSIPELRQLDLQLTVAGRRALREDVEDQLAAIEDLELGLLGDRTSLGRREVAIEDQHVREALHAAKHDLLELALADQVTGVHLRAYLQDLVQDFYPGGAGELPQLGQPRRRRTPVPTRDRYEERPAGAPHGPRPGSDRQLGLERSNLRHEVARHLVEGRRLVLAPQLAGGVLREQMGPANDSGKTVRANTDGGDEIEPEEREVGQVIPRQGFRLEMGVHEPQSAQASFARASAADVRQIDAAGVSDENRLDLALPGEQDAELAVQLEGQLGEVTRQLRAAELARRDAPSVGGAEPVELTLLQAQDVAGEISDGCLLLHLRRGVGSFNSGVRLLLHCTPSVQTRILAGVSLDNRPARDEPIASVDQLIAFLREGEKPRERFRVGMEHEKIGLVGDTVAPVPYDGSRGIEELLSRLPRFGYDLFLEEGRPIAALQGGLSISLEPGGQLELSGRPFACSHDLSRELNRHLALVRALGAELGQIWMGVGYRPFGRVADARWMPKGRYRRMREHLARTGALGLDMMTMTATVQANFDFSDEADMARKVRAATLVSPLVTALFANSPLREGRESGYLSFRTEVWRQTDPARCGLQAWALHPDFGYRAYVEWALDVPMIFVRRDDDYRDPRGLTFRRFMAEGLDGERATLTDWEDHLTTLFPEVRVKRVIEVRGADAGTAEMCAALPTLWKGLLYDPDATEAASKLVRAGHAELVALSEDVSRRALSARLGNRTVLDLARELVDIAVAGLHHQRGCGGDEVRFVEPLRQVLEDRRCPAEVALAKLRGELGGDPARLVDHWRIA